MAIFNIWNNLSFDKCSDTILVIGIPILFSNIIPFKIILELKIGKIVMVKLIRKLLMTYYYMSTKFFF